MTITTNHNPNTEAAEKVLTEKGFSVGSLSDDELIHYFVNWYLLNNASIQQSDILHTSSKEVAQNAAKVGFRVQGMQSVKGGYTAYIWLA